MCTRLRTSGGVENEDVESDERREWYDLVELKKRMKTYNRYGKGGSPSTTVVGIKWTGREVEETILVRCIVERILQKNLVGFKSKT